MAKFLYSAAMSLDGFIAGPGGDMSWMIDYLGPNPVVDELIPQTGAILAGNRTFGGDEPHKGRPGEGEVFGGGWEGPQFVLTHHPPADPVAGVTFVRDIDTAITESRAAAAGRYVNILGAGTRLFAHPGGKTVRLEQIGVTHTPTVTNLWYRVTAWQGPVPARP